MHMNSIRNLAWTACAALLIGIAGCGSPDAKAVPTATQTPSAAAPAVSDAPVTAATGSDKAALEADLKQFVTLAGQLMDGDECHAVLTPRTYQTMWRIDPRDQWAASDNYEYDEAVAIRVKKQLIRLARTRGYKCDCNLWLDCPEKKNTIQCAIKNVNNCCPYAPWGALYEDTPPVMQEALKGSIITGSASGDWVSAFAPIRNSMGDVVGLLEIASRVEYFKARAAKAP